MSRVTTTSLYNLDSQPSQRTYPDSTVLTLSYEDDATTKKGRLLSMTLTPPSGGRYASLTRQATYHAGSGYLKALTDSRGPSLSYLYDGPFTTQTNWTGTVQGNVGYGYDNFFRLSSLSVNGAQSISYGYDNDGLLTQAGALTLSRNSANGFPTGTVLAQVSTTLGHNGYGEMEDLTALYGSTSLFALKLKRDAAGRIYEKQETLQGVTHVYSYTYDTAGRLKQVLEDGVLVSFAEYDNNAAGNGNRTSFTQVGLTRTATYDAQDRLLTYGNNTYTYGPNGDLQTKEVGTQRTTYVYDALGNLLSATLPDGTQVEYIIDAQNRRMGKKVNGVLVQGFLYDGQLRIIAELNGNNQVVSRFVYGTQGHSPDYMVKDGVTYRILTDHLGSPRLVVDVSTGIIAQRMDHDAWGNRLADTNPGFQPFGFAGGLYDSHTHLVRFGARDYDAEIGRWNDKDPIRFAGGDSNLYAYCSNDPVNLIDPTGLDAFDWMHENMSWFEDLNLQPAANLAAGFGHGLTWGLTSRVLALNGADKNVDKCSGLYTAGKWTGVGVNSYLLGSFAFRPFASATQQVTHWNTAARVASGTIRPGSWVMTGGQTWRNFIMAGIPGRYSFNNAVTMTVPRSALRWPSGIEFFKGLLGQRIYMP